jgi:imidazolonepropionase
VRRGPALRDLGVIEDGSVLIQDGLVAAVGRSRRVENLKEAKSAREISVNGSIVMPGFVDANFNLGIEDGYASSSKRRKTSTEFYDETLSLLRSCSQHGTLTVEVKANADSPDLRSQFPILRQLARFDSTPVRLVRTCRLNRLDNADGQASEGLTEAFAVIRRERLIRYLELKGGAETLLDAKLLLRAAEHANVRFKLLWTGGSSDNLAALLSSLNPLTVCCPGYLSPAECSLLSSTPGIIVFSPTSEVFEGPAASCARHAVEGGAAIALSTGYDVTHAPTFSMQMVLALAVIRLGLRPEEAVTSATINAAYATGCGDSVGSLEVGKQADLLVMNVPDYREIHRQFGVNHVELAIREGSVVFSRLPLKLGAW